MKFFKKTLFFVLLIALVGAFTLVLTACGGNPLVRAVDEINADEALHAELQGLYAVHAVAEGDSTLKVVFQAEIEELATREISEAVSNEAASQFQIAVEEMRRAGISEPAVVLEFFDMGGSLIYVRYFS